MEMYSLPCLKKKMIKYMNYYYFNSNFIVILFLLKKLKKTCMFLYNHYLIVKIKNNF